MTNEKKDRPALLIIDMVKDNFRKDRPLPITPFAQAIIPSINRLAAAFRQREWPVVFPTDAFHEDDFFFTGRMHPHSLAGTQGAEIVEDLVFKPEDYWMPKPSMSAFFKTTLHEWLTHKRVTLCAMAGIATPFCVLASAFDALSHSFKTVILEDCCAAASAELHQTILSVYRRNPLYPLLRVVTASDLLASWPSGH